MTLLAFIDKEIAFHRQQARDLDQARLDGSRDEHTVATCRASALTHRAQAMRLMAERQRLVDEAALAVKIAQQPVITNL